MTGSSFPKLGSRSLTPALEPATNNSDRGQPRRYPILQRGRFFSMAILQHPLPVVVHSSRSQVSSQLNRSEEMHAPIPGCDVVAVSSPYRIALVAKQCCAGCGAAWVY